MHELGAADQRILPASDHTHANSDVMLISSLKRSAYWPRDHHAWLARARAHLVEGNDLFVRDDIEARLGHIPRIVAEDQRRRQDRERADLSTALSSAPFTSVPSLPWQTLA